MNDTGTATSNPTTGTVSDSRIWLLVGTPLVCGSCLTDIDPIWDDWQLFGEWAEHTACRSRAAELGQDDALIAGDQK